MIELEKVMLEDLERFNKSDWISVQKGNLSFLSCTEWISCYTTDLIIEGENPIKNPLQVCSNEE